MYTMIYCADAVTSASECAEAGDGEEFMHKLVKNKELMAAKEEMNLGELTDGSSNDL